MNLFIKIKSQMIRKMMKYKLIQMSQMITEIQKTLNWNLKTSIKINKIIKLKK